MFDLNSVQIVDLPKIRSENGSITAINNGQDIFFDTKRVYYLYDIPSDLSRGGHAHRALNQLIVAVSGSFDVLLDDGKNRKSFHLARPNIGLLLKPGIWRELRNFSGGAVCLVLASEEYSEADYIRDYDKFLDYRGIH